MADDRATVYQEGDRWVFRASGLGTCVRVLWAHMQGITPAPTPEWLQEKFDQGNAAEEPILDWVEKDYFGTVWRRQEEVEINVGSRAVIRGHIDGVLKADGAESVVEAKAFARSTYDKFTRALGNDTLVSEFPYYAAQISVYMTALDMPCSFVIGIKDDDGKVIDHDVFTFEQPPIPLAKIKAAVAKAVATETMPDCDKSVYPCPFWELHDEKDIVLSEDAWLGMMAKAYFEAVAAGKKAEQTKKDSGEYIKKTMAEVSPDGDDVEVHDGDGKTWKVHIVEQPGREQFDLKAAKDDGVEVDKYMKPGRPYSYPKITPPSSHRTSEESKGPLGIEEDNAPKP